MIWQNPWAWLGMLALAVPVVIHLLGLRSAKITRFPTLRFVRPSRLLATRRTRLTDLGLLAVRMAIIAAAVAALAMPLLLTGNRQRERGRSVARAIIVDTSESMTRTARDGSALVPAVNVARNTARRLAGEAATSVIIETTTPSAALAGASGWLATQRVRRELLIMSDFQIGALDSTDLAAVPPDVGITLTRIELEPGAEVIAPAVRQGDATLRANVTLDSMRSTIEWSSASAANVPSPADSLLILAAESERAAANAALAAARGITATRPMSGRPIAIVYSGAARFPELLASAKPLRQPWQGDVLVQLRSDPQLLAAAAIADIGDDVMAAPGMDSAALVSVARTSAGRTVLLATSGTIDGTDRMVLLPLAPPGSLLSAAVIAASLRASSDVRAPTELEPAFVATETLARWQRDPALGANAGLRDDVSDGRWLWLLVLVLLAVETWMRRARRESRTQEVVRDRAA